MEELNKKLSSLYVNKNWDSAVSVIFELCRFLNIETEDDFSLISDNQKINANVGRFEKAFGFIDRPATYELYTKNQNIEIKTFWVNKVSKTNLSWIVGISPNFEDGKVYQSDKYKIGIDIVVPKECDRIILLVSNNLKVRSLELKQKLSRTDLEIFEKLSTLKNKSVDTIEDKKVYHNILWDAFNFEPINRKFYKELVDRFSVLREHLISKGFDDQDAVMFSTRLIGRLLFVWFLRKKNLINEGVGYFDASDTSAQTDYYKNKLERLFFNTLNTEILERDFDDNKTPYLNGGLFEPTRTDFYKDGKLSFPNGFFSQFYEVLSHYNFTVDESSPEFEQVAVDPEMLGRIFESLLAEQRTETGEQARKAKGAFYTPREIVSYMCEESLKEYLKTKIEDDAFRDTRIQEVVSMSESAFRDQDHNKRRDWKPYQTQIVKALDELSVFDPAVGSGAYPMGMLHLLVKVYTRVDSKYEKNLSKLKRDILSRSLYGSDIDSTAIEISRLRAWLSLVVDMEEGEQVAPLPNLEFHFVCANTLISLPTTQDGLFDSIDKSKLREKREKYYSINNKKEKEKLKNEYEKLIIPKLGSSFYDDAIRTYRPFSHESRASFFDPDLMFGVGKFDIVIGNPPYISAKNLDKDFKNILAKNYLTAIGQFDLYALFIEKSFSVLNIKGVSCFITANTFLSNKYFAPLRQILIKEKTIKEIINFGETIFESAKVGVAIIFVKNNIQEKQEVKMCNSLESFNKKDFSFISQSVLDNPDINFEIKLNTDVATSNILESLFNNTKTLYDFMELPRGIEIGSNSDKISNIRSEKSRQLLVGKNIKKYSTEFDNKYIDFEENKSVFKDHTIYDSTKILIQRIRNLSLKQRIIATVDSDKYLVTNTLRIGLLKNTEDNIFFYLGLLNSSLVNFIFLNAFHNTDIYSYQLQRIPLPENISSLDKEKIGMIATNILKVKKENKDADTYVLEKEIDQLVYKLYGLNEEEIKIVEESK